MNVRRTALYIIVFLSLLPRLLAFSQADINWDDMLYALVARDLTRGLLPYSGTFDHKPIGLYYVFALFQTLVGPGLLAVRLVALCAVIATLMLLHRLAMAVDSAHPGLICGIAVYGGLSLLNGGLASNTEILLNAFILIAFVVTLRKPAFQSLCSLDYFICGLVLGFAVQVNYLAVILMLGWIMSLCTCTILEEGRRQDIRGVRYVAPYVVGAALGAGIPLAPILLGGDVVTYVRMQTAYLAAYASTPPVPRGSIVAGLTFVIPLTLFLGAVAAKHVLVNGTSKEHLLRGSERRSLIVCFFVINAAAACLAIAASRKFWDHCFLLLLPSLCGLAIVTAGWQRTLLARRIVGLVICAAVVATSAEPVMVFCRDAMYTVAIGFEGSHRDFIGKVAFDVRGELARGDYIYVYRGDHTLYYLTGAEVPTQFPFPPHQWTREVAVALGISAE